MGPEGNEASAARHLAARGIATIAALTGLWWFVAWVFSSDRGLDLTDESLYLLALDPPSKEAGWVTPFGWSTSPLYDVVGHDIARTRTLAVVLLVVVGGLLGRAVARWVEADRAGIAALVTVGAIGAPLLTASFLRTPGYNWANLLGLMIGVAGIALAVRAPHHDDDGRWYRRVDLHVAAAVIALGCVTAVPAKSTSGIVLVALTLLVLWRESDSRRALNVVTLTAAWGVALVLLCIATGRWPASFLSVLWASASFPPLHENQTIGGALHDLLRTPKVAWQQLSKLRTTTLALVAIAIGITVVVRRKPRARWQLRCAPLALCTVAAVGTAVPWPLLGLPNPAFRFAWFGTTNAALLLLLGAALHVAANWTGQRRIATRSATIVVALGVLVLAFGFGSAMSIYNQAALAAVLILLAAGVLAIAVADDRCRVAGGALIALATLFLTVTNVVDSRHHPYNYADIAQQTMPLTIGAHENTLLVQGDTAAYLDGAQTTAGAAGLCTGTRLIGLNWGWSSAEPFALGATVPDSLILTIFGYPDAVTLLPVTMARMDDAAWHDAWVMTTDRTTISAEQLAELQVAFDRLPTTVGRTYPDDYTLAATAGNTQFWRPTNVDSTPCG